MFLFRCLLALVLLAPIGPDDNTRLLSAPHPFPRPISLPPIALVGEANPSKPFVYWFRPEQVSTAFWAVLDDNQKGFRNKKAVIELTIKFSRPFEAEFFAGHDNLIHEYSYFERDGTYKFWLYLYSTEQPLPLSLPLGLTIVVTYPEKSNPANHTINDRAIIRSISAKVI